ncbi:hypothetical protein WICPIJ_007908 [Wickerhamomyces pijperi]|uniref:Uncharacterized protein n=1 Tax=Wickerhamomyces pijperi TaxID=599730 RepID=A0A9P8PZ30_WICPI|nr:hypothetical protein WICPIJ_007908 [Wickerhamomyces pijperi]
MFTSVPQMTCFGFRSSSSSPSPPSPPSISEEGIPLLPCPAGVEAPEEGLNNRRRGPKSEELISPRFARPSWFFLLLALSDLSSDPKSDPLWFGSDPNCDEE